MSSLCATLDWGRFDRALTPEEIAQLHAEGPGNTYTYDANGNMTQRFAGGKTYVQGFDAENKLQTVTEGGQTTTFTYDGDGNRVKKEDPSGTTYYVGGYYEVQGSTVTKCYTDIVPCQVVRLLQCAGDRRAKRAR